MQLSAPAQQEVTQRLQASQAEREATRQLSDNGQLLQADTPERIEKRKAQILSNPAFVNLLGSQNYEALSSQAVLEAPESAQKAFEKAIGSLDTQPAWFLSRGAEIRRTVGRIHIRDSSRRFGWGTGFLVAPNLLVTNQHVLNDLTTAKYSRVEFDFEESFDGDLLQSSLFDLDPMTLFISSPAKDGLDYALVAVRSQCRAESQAQHDLAEFGYNRLIAQEGKLLKGELINCIHHPEGQPRQVSLRENRLMALQNPQLEGIWMHYETDTESGSSGAPLFNNQWQVVGIHHAGVPNRDANGNILAIGGGVWQAAMGEREKWWYANEGLRISRFVADVAKQAKAILANPQGVEGAIVTPAGYALIEQMLNPTQSQEQPQPQPQSDTTVKPPQESAKPAKKPQQFNPE